VNELFYTVKDFLGEKYLTQRARISHAATPIHSWVIETLGTHLKGNIHIIA
jgi:hypothetical protein